MFRGLCFTGNCLLNLESNYGFGLPRVLLGAQLATASVANKSHLVLEHSTLTLIVNKLPCIFLGSNHSSIEPLNNFTIISSILSIGGIMTLTSVQYGFVVGAIPTACMLLSSAFISQYEISKIVEAILQNFSAGLILAAVGGELFPLLYLDKSPADTAIGITLGFAFGLALNYGLDAFVEQFEDDEDDDDEGDKKVKHLGEHAEGREILAKNAEYYKKLGGVSGIEMSMDDIELSNKKEKIRKDTTPSPSSSMKKSDVNSVNNTGDVEMADMGGQYGQITSDGSRKPRSDSNQSNNDSIPNAGSDAGSDEDRGDKQFESTKGLRTALGYVEIYKKYMPKNY